jgi:hypothetical protein
MVARSSRRRHISVSTMAVPRPARRPPYRTTRAKARPRPALLERLPPNVCGTRHFDHRWAKLAPRRARSYSLPVDSREVVKETRGASLGKARSAASNKEMKCRCTEDGAHSTGNGSTEFRNGHRKPPRRKSLSRAPTAPPWRARHPRARFRPARSLHLPLPYQRRRNQLLFGLHRR